MNDHIKAENVTSHVAQYRVYYEDTDAAGVVYYANYLKYAERARTDMLRELGVNQSELYERDGVGFVVRRCEAQYIAPARLDDVVEVETSVSKMSAVKFTMRQLLKRAGNGDSDESASQILVEIEVDVVAVGRNFKPVRIPQTVKDKLL